MHWKHCESWPERLWRVFRYGFEIQMRIRGDMFLAGMFAE